MACIQAFLLLSFLAVASATSRGQWATSTLSDARYLLASASVNDQVLFGGGGSGSAHNCRVDRYSASNDEWMQECLSLARSWLSAASVTLPSPANAAFALFAGGYTTIASNRIDVFNAVTHSWSVSPISLSIPRFAMASTSLDALSLVFFAGGRDVGSSTKTFPTVDCLKIASTGSITAFVLNMSVPRQALAATSLPLQSIALFAGGFTSAGFASSVVDVYNAESQEWIVASLSVPRAYLAAVTLPSQSLAFFAGGWSGSSLVGNCSRVVDIYNGVTKTWSQAALSVARHLLAAAALDLQGLVVFAGGLKAATQSFTGQYSNDVDIFTVSTGTWSTYTLTTARSMLVSAALPLRGLLFLAGGFTGLISNQIDIWDVRTNSLGALSPVISLSNPARGGRGVSMTITMSPDSPIPVNGKIVITLTGPFNCSAGTPVQFSPSGSPARTGAVSVQGSSMVITIMSGIFIGQETFSMTLNGVTNPPLPQTTSLAVNAATLNEHGRVIGSSTVGNLVAVVPNLGVASPSISLSSVLASQKQVAMTISLLPEVAIPSTGRLLITLPGRGWDLPSQTAVQFLSSNQGAAATAFISANTSVLAVQFASGTFPAQSAVSFQIPRISKPPASEAINPTIPLNARHSLGIASALTDVSSVIIGASVDGTLPLLVNDFGCDSDSYFEARTLACVHCGAGMMSPQGSVGSSACRMQIDVALLAGLCVLVAFIGMVYLAYRFYSKWVQRHAVFKILDLDPDIATMTDHERSQAPPNYSRIQLLKETAAFPRPVASLSVAGNLSGSEELKPAFHALNKERDKCMWYFITSKFRSSESNSDLTDIISDIELVRFPESKEIGFRNKLFESSRAQTLLSKNLKFETCEANESLVKAPLFQAGKIAYEKRCSKLVRGLEHINLMFAWFGCGTDSLKAICDTGIKKVAKSTDPGFFGEACYLSPEVQYALRYSTMNSDDVTDAEKIGVILFACECPKTPYVVTSADYPIAMPPLRDPGIPYGFSRFFGRQMQLACSAHWVAVKKVDPKGPNHLHEYFRNDASDWEPDGGKMRHKPSGKMFDGGAGSGIPLSFDDVLLQANYVRIGDHAGCGIFQYQPHAAVVNRLTGLHTSQKNPDKSYDDSNSNCVYGYPNLLLPSLLDYQYHPEEGCEGHELVIPEGNSFPIAVVWFKKADYMNYKRRVNSAAATNSTASSASVVVNLADGINIPGSCRSSPAPATSFKTPSIYRQTFPSPPPVVPVIGNRAEDQVSKHAADHFLSRGD